MANCRYCATDCPEQGEHDRFFDCALYTDRKPTNADRIRSMSDEELAKEVTRNPPIPCRMCEYWDCKLSLCRAWADDFTCTTGYAEALMLDWLRQPVDGEG